jgi:hypothetical protein
MLRENFSVDRYSLEVYPRSGDADSNYKKKPQIWRTDGSIS